MTNSDLLKEAIADAKAVKETAIANARLALEEAFTPRIQSMISSKLQEEEDEMDGEMEPEMEPNMEPEMDMDLDAGLDVGDLSIDLDQDGQFDEFDVMSKPTPEVPVEEPTEEPVEEYDLSEILRQLDEEDEEEGHEYEEAPSDPFEDEMDGDEDSDIDIDSLLEELMDGEEMDYDDLDRPNNDAYEKALSSMDEVKKMKKENDKMKEELNEAYSAIKTMKASLNEVNMLNAKLLFTNKLFKAHNLNESQKVKVIDNFDRARTIREVKLVYATLSESLSNKKTLVKESVASKVVASTRPKQIILSESQVIANRFKKLAGLK